MLGTNDYLSAVGTTRGQMVQVNLTASTNLKSLDEFRDLVITSQNGAYVRLSDVANVTLGSTDYDSQANFDGNPGVVIAHQRHADRQRARRHQGRARGSSPASMRNFPRA